MAQMKGANSTEGVNVPAIVTSAGEVIASNEDRYSWGIQNVGTNVVYVNLGGTASTTVFHRVLKGGTGDSDGLGGSWDQEGSAIFTGSITIAGTSPKVVVTELGG